jgi:probable rRNA maturation factor
MEKCPPQIRVRNLQRKIPVNVAALQNLAAKAVGRCLQLHTRRRTELSKLREIFVWLISDRRMSRLHRQFLGEEGPTDVLTFQHGEIFISVEIAKRNAGIFATSLIRELQLYVIHGLLHLHEFDDLNSSAARKMKCAEKILGDCSALPDGRRRFELRPAYASLCPEPRAGGMENASADQQQQRGSTDERADGHRNDSGSHDRKETGSKLDLPWQVVVQMTR